MLWNRRKSFGSHREATGRRGVVPATREGVLRIWPHEEARTAYERALELDPKDAFTHLFVGNSYYRSRMYPEALAAFVLRPNSCPMKQSPSGVRGTLTENWAYALAQQAFETAVRVAPDDQQAQVKFALWNGCRRGVTDKTHDMIRLAYRNDQAATTVSWPHTGSERIPTISGSCMTMPRCCTR